MPGASQFDGRATRTGWTWPPASGEEQREVVPNHEKGEGVSIKQSSLATSRLDGKNSPYRALKLGSLASATLNNVVNANVSGAELLLAAAGDAVIAIATAVAVDARAVRVAVEGVALYGARAALFAAHGTAAAGAVRARRLAPAARRTGTGGIIAVLGVAGIAVGLTVGVGRGGRLLKVVLGVAVGGNGGFFNDTNVDDHVVAEVFVACDECGALVILEADALGASPTGVEAIKVLDSGDDGVSCVMGVDLHSHREARTILRRVEKQQLKCDVLGRQRLAGGDTAAVGRDPGHGGSGIDGGHGSHDAVLCGVKFDRWPAMESS